MEIDLNLSDTQLQQMTECEWDTIALSSFFTPADFTSPSIGLQTLNASTKRLLETCAPSLKIGGALFVYGAPHRLPAYAELLETLGDDDWRLEFRYWIAVQLHEQVSGETLHPAHVGILLFHKVARTRITYFGLNRLRMPHTYCPACGQNVKDWGGKSHLMSPNGTLLSDVWADLPMRPLTDHIMPEDVIQRIASLVDGQLLHVVEREGEASAEPYVSPHCPIAPPPHRELPFDRIEIADCMEFMESLLPVYEHNAFDLIFADPPYNLAKLYTNYTDAQAAEEYLAWCDRWLKLCSRLLKPGGSMFVLNLPKWGFHHTRTLDGLLDFRHWIAWQALAEPRGKIMPAHYSLLYYTKPGGSPVCNSDQCAPNSQEYCLRARCIEKRKAAGNDKKAPLTDVWTDIFRIKHKRDRDYHPCQLPEKLLERIILLSSNPGQVIFDPFCGVGTTAIVAKRLGRHFITTDVDPKYAHITEAKLEQMEQSPTNDVARAPVSRKRNPMTKRHIESVIQQIALDLGRMPNMTDIQHANPDVHKAILDFYPNPRKILAAARLVLNK